MQDAFPWARQASFSAQTRASLRELNHRFLDLAAAHSDHMKLPRETSAHIASLSAQQRSAAADCPYALFDLRFHDDAHWRARLGEAWRIADEAAVQQDVAAFVRLALFYAWHLASTPRLGAQLWLGMAEPTAAAFRAASLERLPALAAGEAANLSARWCTSRFYWSALACAAAQDDSRRLRRVQLFGLQLGAALLLP
ncbi:MAG: hypothetical protein ABSG30_04495 [Steroidobacteraceae bacterium]|jgi:hypothetical protein